MKVFIPIIAASALVASTVSGWSGSPSTGDLKVKMKIDQRCQVNPNGDAVLDFGTLGFVTKDVDSKGTIQVQCTKGVVYSIALGKSKNYLGGGGWRAMRGGDSLINYRLYSDNNYTKAWTDDYTSANPTLRPLTDLTADGTLQSIPVYGRVEKSDVASAPIGTYTDTVTVTVTVGF